MTPRIGTSLSARRQSLALAIAFVVIVLAAQLALAALVATLGSERLGARASLLLGQVAGLLVPALMFLRLRPANAGPARRLDPVGGLALAAAVPVGWIAAAAAQVATVAALQRIGWSGLDGARERVAEAYGRVLLLDGAADAVLTALLVCVLAPIIEELAFRGVLQRLLARAAGPTAAVVIGAAVFAALHLEPLGLVPRFLIGLGCGALAHRLGRLEASIALHAAFNGISLLLVVLVGARTALGIQPAPDHVLVPALAIAVAASLAFLGLVTLAPLRAPTATMAEPA